MRAVPKYCDMKNVEQRNDSGNNRNVAKPGVRWQTGLALVVLLFALAVPRLLVLRQFVTIDEYKWMIRSTNFYFALRQGNLIATYQKEHPGVTAMWAGVGSLWGFFSEEIEAGEGQFDTVAYRALLREHGLRAIDMLASGRSFMVVANTAVLLLAFLFARRLLGFWPATVGFLLVAFDPFHAAHSSLWHLDGLLGSFMLLSLLSYLSFLQEHRRLHLAVSGVAAGLSWLTKSPGFFLIPIMGLITLFILVQNMPQRQNRARALWQYGKPLIAWGLLGGATFVILWPAMWVGAPAVLREIFTGALRHAERGHPLPLFFNGMLVSGENMDEKLRYFYPIAYLWRATPAVLAGLVLALAAFVDRLGTFAEMKTRTAVTGFVLFALGFALLMNIGSQKFDRYLLPIHAPLDIVAGAGWVALAAWIKTKSSTARRTLATLVTGGVILWQASGVIGTYPYYLSYYNPLLGGSAAAPQVMTIGWGEGLDQAARYLNQKSGARRLQVASWYFPSFSFFFSGTTIDVPARPNPAYLRRILSADYVVVYIHQWQRQLPAELLQRFAGREPEHTIWINGLEYARIYKVMDPVDTS